MDGEVDPNGEVVGWKMRNVYMKQECKKSRGCRIEPLLGVGKAVMTGVGGHGREPESQTAEHVSRRAVRATITGWAVMLLETSIGGEWEKMDHR